MRRRIFASGIAVGLINVAGCLASGTAPGKKEPSELNLKDVSASVTKDYPLSVEATIKQNIIDSKQTARFNLAVTWNGNEPQGFVFGNKVPFSYPNYSSDGTGILLLPVDSGIERQEEDSWVPKTDDTGQIPTELNLITANLNPGETVTGNWEVWTDPNNAVDIRPGLYHFENEIGLSSDYSEENKDSIGWTLIVDIDQQ